MRKIHDRLFVGTENQCFHNKKDWAVVHACKSPCHQGAVGYRGSLSSNHPNYLVLEVENNLYLNMIDTAVPLFMPSLFTEFLRFSNEKWQAGLNLLIHCNQGQSRAPSLGLLFLAKNVNLISTESYQTAVTDYIRIDPVYNPGLGIQKYLANNWHAL